MARSFFRLTNLPVAALGIVAAGFGAAALTLGNTDAVVERGFARALASKADRTDAGKPVPAISGTEEFWLTHVVHNATVPLTTPVAVGDRLTISSGGREQVLHVVNVDKIDSKIVPISSERPTHLLLVTCRDQAKPEARPIRFLLEADDELPALSSARTARAL
jgi:hypothetical protein